MVWKLHEPRVEAFERCTIRDDDCLSVHLTSLRYHRIGADAACSSSALMYFYDQGES